MTCCQHNHDHEHEDFHAPAPPPTDPAARSLTDALRVSFRLLAVIMVFVVIAFAMTGVQSIEPQEQGIIKVFGRYVGVAKPGLVYNWPFPIGEIEIVPVREETITIDDFWMLELPDERAVELSARRVNQGGLRPGWDGMLITGDRNLLHVRLTCNYVIQEPLTVRMQAADLGELVRTAVCTAAIRAAATRTADGIWTAEQSEFVNDIRTEAQRQLRALLMIDDPSREGVTITKVFLARNSMSVPLAALETYNAAQQALTLKNQLISSAKGDAETTVNEAAGASYRALVGEPYEQLAQAEIELAQAGGNYDLIGQYNRARQAGEQVPAEALLDRIDEVLLSSATSGEASRLLAEARAEKTDKIEQARSRYQRYAELLSEFSKSPDFLIQRHWAEVREAILESPLVEKVYIPPSDQKAVFHVNRDPEITRQIERELLKSQPKANP